MSDHTVEDAATESEGFDVNTVLVLIDGAEVGAHVTTRVHELHATAPDLNVYVLVPAAAAVASIHGHQVEGVERAHAQLEAAIALFENIGLRATGEVGPHDPMKATKQALTHLRPDLILVSTLPLGSSRWLNMDLPHRLRRRFRIPVEYVMGKPVNDNDWQTLPDPIEGPLRVLLVEDSPAEAHLMRHALAESSVRIDLSVVGDGAEAIDELRRRGQDSLDLVLLDLRMPHVDGHEFLEIVGREFDVDALNVTVVTGSRDTGDRELAHALGAGAYVYKDADVEVFTQTIISVIDEVAHVEASVGAHVVEDPSSTLNHSSP